MKGFVVLVISILIFAGIPFLIFQKLRGKRQWEHKVKLFKKNDFQEVWGIISIEKRRKKAPTLKFRKMGYITDFWGSFEINYNSQKLSEFQVKQRGANSLFVEQDPTWKTRGRAYSKGRSIFIVLGRNFMPNPGGEISVVNNKGESFDGKFT